MSSHNEYRKFIHLDLYDIEINKLISRSKSI